MWDLPRPGLEPVSLALAGRFPTTVPSGKPYLFLRDSVLAGCMFLETCPFLVVCPFCWHITVHSIFLWFFVFLHYWFLFLLFHFFFFFFKMVVIFSFLNLYIFFFLYWVFLSMQGLSLVVASGGHSSSRYAGHSLSRHLLFVEHRLQMCRLSSCGSRAQLLCSMWDLPRPGLEPMSLALAGGFSTTALPGKPLLFHFLFCLFGSPVFSSWWACPEVCGFCLSFQRTSSWFYWLFKNF